MENDMKNTAVTLFLQAVKDETLPMKERMKAAELLIRLAGEDKPEPSEEQGGNGCETMQIRVVYAGEEGEI